MEESNIKAIIFDFDGTLVDSVQAYVDAFYDAFKKYGIEVDREQIRDLLGYTAPKIIKQLIGNHPRIEEITQTYFSIVKAPEFVNKIKPMRGAKEILSYLRKKNILLFIVSGSDKKIMEEILKNTQLKSYFKEILSTKDDNFKEKPNPEAINYLLKKYSLKHNEVVLIGDGKLDYLMAKNSNISFIAIRDTLDEKFSYENNIPLIYSLEELKRIFSKKILAIVGMPGSGKTTVRELIHKTLKCSFIRFGDITEEYLKQQNLEVNEINERKVREMLRQKYGMEAYAKLNEERIKEMLKNSPILIIDGLYSWEEYLYLKDHFKEDIFLIGVITHKMLRYYRLNQRKIRKLNYEDAYTRDIRELRMLNKAFPIVMADYYILNDLDIDNLKKQISWVITQIMLIPHYFSN